MRLDLPLGALGDVYGGAAETVAWRGFLKDVILPSRESDSVGLGWSPRICLSNKLPGDAGTSGPGTLI